jgi:hypothetical protein
MPVFVTPETPGAPIAVARNEAGPAPAVSLRPAGRFVPAPSTPATESQ